MERRTAYVILNSLPGIGPGRVRLMEQYLGSPEAILDFPDRLSKIPGIGSATEDTVRNWRKFCNPERELKLAADSGTYLMTLDDDSYPPLLREIHDPPMCLYVRGSLQVMKDSSGSIAIVGSRHISQYGARMARQLATEAAANGWIVLSGLAHGIDTQAHSATVQAGGRTIAVLGSGLSQLYPHDNLPLAKEICRTGGAVISEFPMMYRPDRRSFPMRNRIISGLSRGTIVVEGGCQSGSLITAATATEQGRTVFAVPGLADQPYAKGCHALLKDGARLVESFQDVLDEFSLLPEARSQSRHRMQQKREAENPPPPPPPIMLGELEYGLWQAIGEEECQLETLLARVDEPPSTVLPAILVMELKNLVKQLPGKRIIRIRGKNVQKKA